MNNKPKVAVVVPCFDEMECAPELIRRVSAVRLGCADRLDIRLLIVDDGSTDGSSEYFIECSISHDWVSVLQLSRNFGHQAALMAGLEHAEGEFVATIDGDLQDPPELIPLMIEVFTSGHSRSLGCVYGKRIERKSESMFKRSTAYLFYRLLRRFTRIDIPTDAGDFRVLTRSSVEILRQFPERRKYLRGLIPWSGIECRAFEYERDPRFAGRSKYGVKAMFDLATDALTGFSTFQKWMIQFVMMTFLISGLFSCVLSLAALAIDGVSTLAVLFLMMSFNFLAFAGLAGSVGLVAGYSQRIQEDVRGRPQYLVKGIYNS